MSPIGGADHRDREGTAPDESEEEARALRTLAETSDAMVHGARRLLAPWLETRMAAIADAWGLTGDARVAFDRDAADAVSAATRRVVAALAELLAADPAAQRLTPLEVLRSAHREPGTVLAAAGVPPVARDEFAERSFPDDRYGLAPGAWADLGDPDLVHLQLAWGLAKARVLRARARKNP